MHSGTVVVRGNARAERIFFALAPLVNKEHYSSAHALMSKYGARIALGELLGLHGIDVRLSRYTRTMTVGPGATNLEGVKILTTLIWMFGKVETAGPGPAGGEDVAASAGLGGGALPSGGSEKPAKRDSELRPYVPPPEGAYDDIPPTPPR